MRKKTIYKWMGVIVSLTIIAFAIVYFLGLQSKVEKARNIVDRNGPPVFSHLLQGDFDKALDKPMDVSKVGEFIYVTDTNHKQVQVFDSAGSPIFQFGKEGEGEGQFKFPYGVTGDNKGNVYVADMYTGKISIFTSKGKFIKYFEELDKKTHAIKSPAGIRIYKKKLYVTDIEANKVFVYDLNGKKLLEIVGLSTQDVLMAPNAVAIDNSGNIFVADSGNQRILEFNKKGKPKRLINGAKDKGGSSIFVNPRGIGIDSRGILYIVNNLTHTIYGFDKKGKEVFSFGGMGSDNEKFYLPNGLFVDSDDQVYITDTLNQRVAVYY